MSNEELIERITNEILARLKKEDQEDKKDSKSESEASSTAEPERTGAEKAVQQSQGGQEDRGGQGGPREANKVTPVRYGRDSTSGSDLPDPGQLNPGQLAKLIDHTLLKPDATQEQIDRLIQEAKEYAFFSVCVNSSWVAYCVKKLRGTGVKVAAVVGFPLGAMHPRAKNFETRGAIENGAAEIDMVINVGALKSGDYKLVEDDIRWVLRACRGTTILKCIIETALLSDQEKVIACEIAKKAGAHFVKTSTGFSKTGATVEDVALMRRTVGPKIGVKASGGIRSYADAVAMLRAGATRLGTSSGIAIINGQ